VRAVRACARARTRQKVQVFENSSIFAPLQEKGWDVKHRSVFTKSAIHHTYFAKSTATPTTLPLPPFLFKGLPRARRGHRSQQTASFEERAQTGLKPTRRTPYPLSFQRCGPCGPGASAGAYELMLKKPSFQDAALALSPL
jgi:hypothetical protein